MENRFGRSILAGIAATAVMTALMFMAPLMGLPEMNIPMMLSGMLGVSLALGWVMHIMIGLIFAFVYVYWFNPHVHIHSRAGKGLLYGMAVYVFAMVMMFLMSRMFPMPPGLMEKNMLLMIIGSLIGHLVFGLVIGLLVPSEEAGTHRHRDYQLS